LAVAGISLYVKEYTPGVDWVRWAWVYLRFVEKNNLFRSCLSTCFIIIFEFLINGIVSIHAHEWFVLLGNDIFTKHDLFDLPLPNYFLSSITLVLECRKIFSPNLHHISIMMYFK